MAELTMPHPKYSWNLIGSGFQVKEADAADFKSGDLIKLDNGRVDKFTDTVAANALRLGFANSDAQQYQASPRKNWWPDDVADATYIGRGLIVYRVTDEDLLVFSLVGNAPADITTLRGQKRNIAYDVAAKVVMVQAGATAPRVEILDIIEGKNDEPNPKLLCRPIMGEDYWL